MSEPIVITIEGPPVAKARPRLGRGGHVFTPPETAAWEKAAKWSARCQMGPLPPLEGPLKAVVTACLAVPPSWSKRKRDDALAGRVWPCVKPDADNFLKATLDALNEVVWIDDAQVVDARIVKAYSSRPRVVVMVEALHENPKQRPPARADSFPVGPAE